MNENDIDDEDDDVEVHEYGCFASCSLIISLASFAMHYYWCRPAHSLALDYALSPVQFCISFPNVVAIASRR